MKHQPLLLDDQGAAALALDLCPLLIIFSSVFTQSAHYTIHSIHTIYTLHKLTAAPTKAAKRNKAALPTAGRAGGGSLGLGPLPSLAQGKPGGMLGGFFNVGAVGLPSASPSPFTEVSFG